MKFLADMGISMTTVRWLRSRGNDIVHLRERNLQTISDSQVLQVAKRENRVVLTMDLDFGYLVSISHNTLQSVIIFRLENERPANINRRLHDVLRQSSTALMKGAIISVSEDKHRVRILPVQKQ